MGTSALDLMDIVDAAYQIDAPDAQWLQNLANAARPHLDQGFGVAVFEYYKVIVGHRSDGHGHAFSAKRQHHGTVLD
jgi:hypothetical protein